MDPNQPENENLYQAGLEEGIPSEEPVVINQDGTRMIKFPDGSTYIGDEEVDERHVKINPKDHDQNLAAVLRDDVVSRIGFILKSAIEDDIESQSTFFQSIANSIKVLGINVTSETGGDDMPFKGASNIHSMAFFESLLDMLAAAIAALFPSQGVADCIINGESSDELRDIAYRKKAWFNYYLTEIAKEFKKESKRTLFWAMLTGSCYKKVFIDPTLARPTSSFIRPEDFIVNREFSTHLIANRKTHIIHMSKRDFILRKMSGMYRDVDIMEDDGYGGANEEIQRQLNQVSGIDTEGMEPEMDEKYVLYECHVDYYIQEDPLSPDYDLPMPYIVTLDSESGAVLAIRRNWEKDDFLRKKKEYFVNYSLLPSLDGEGYGMINYAGNLAESATALTRQLMNAATYATFPGGIYAAGIRIENNNIRPAPTEFVPIQTGGLPINQVIAPLPYKEPSPALKDLLNMVEDNIRKPSSIVNQKILELAPRAPMGSTLAVLESMQKVPNAILQGFHESLQQELMLFNDRFAEWLPEGTPYPFSVPGGEYAIMKTDFMDNIKVVPSSDPSLQNSSYRFMLSEIVLNQAKSSPELHNMHYVFEYFYKNMGLSEDERSKILLPQQKDEPPFSGDPLTEDQYLMTGKPIRATIDQDHAAHITVHQLVVDDPQSAPQSIATAQAHIQEHRALDLLVKMQAQIGFEMPEDPSQIPPEMQNQIAVAVAQIAQQQMANDPKNQQQQLMDPAAVMDEDSKRKAEIAHERIQLDKLKLDLEEQKVQTNFAIEEMKLQQKQQNDMVKAELEDKKIELDHMSDQKEQLLKEVQYLKDTINNQNIQGINNHENEM